MNTEETEDNPSENGSDTEGLLKSTEILKALTIKKPLKTDVDLFRKLTGNSENQAEAFSKLVSLAKTGSENNGKPVEEMENLRSELEISQETVRDLQAQVQSLSDQLAEKPTEITVEKPVPIPLKGTQFICEPSAEAAKLMRKYRPFLIKKGICSPENFLNDLVSVAVEYYINEKF